MKRVPASLPAVSMTRTLRGGDPAEPQTIRHRAARAARPYLKNSRLPSYRFLPYVFGRVKGGLRPAGRLARLSLMRLTCIQQ